MSARAHSERRHRPRVAPRTQRGRASRIHWDRFGRIVLVLVLFAVLAMYARPLLSVADSWRDSKVEDRRLEDTKRENRRLQKRHEELTKGSDSSTAGGTTATAPTEAAGLPPSSATNESTESGAVAGVDAGSETGGADPPNGVEPEATVQADPAPDPGAGGTGPGGGGGGGANNTGAVSG